MSDGRSSFHEIFRVGVWIPLGNTRLEIVHIQQTQECRRNTGIEASKTASFGVYIEFPLNICRKCDLLGREMQEKWEHVADFRDTVGC